MSEVTGITLITDCIPGSEVGKSIRIFNAAPKMYQMLQCIHKKRLLPENWKNHYKELDQFIKDIEGESSH